MKNKLVPELDKLFIEVGIYRESKDLKNLFEFIKKFRNIAPYNAMLLHVQKPGSQYVASAEYLSGYLDKNKNIPNISIDSILKAVGIIESMINTNKTPRKELVLND